MEDKKQRSEKQKAATAKALAALKAKRQLADNVIEDDMKKQVEDAEERIVQKVMGRLGEYKPPAVEREVIVKQKTKPKQKVVIVEESSESEEEVIIQKVKKAKAPSAPVEKKVEVPPEVAKRTTGNKILDRLYGLTN